MRILSLCFAFFVIFSFSSCGAKKAVVKKNDDIKAVDDFAFNFVKSESLAKVLDKALEEDKLVMLDMYTTWCLPCKMMDQDVFTHQETADIINENYISYKVDAEKANGPDLTVIFDVYAYPTILFLDAKGRVLEKKAGAVYHTELLQMAESALAKSQLNKV